MWVIPTFLGLAALVVLHLWWQRRHQDALSQADRLRRELADLRERQERLAAREQAREQAMFNSMVEGILILGPDGRIQLANQSLERLFVLGSDVRGRTLMEAFRLTALSQLVERLLKEGTVVGFELELPGLERRCFQVNATTVLDRQGAPEGAILIFHDLTRIKQLENTRQEFVANVSHELRTPLSMIKGYVETLLDGAKDDASVSVRFLQTIEKHADRLTYLIEDLLTISRLESGQILLNLQETDVREATSRVVSDLEARAAERRVKLDNQVPEGLCARADSDRLQQVLFNLVDNAIKYGHEGGSVVVAARQREDRQTEIWVRDDGPGIPPEGRDRIFERFYRVDKARSREQGGTGLGLAIVKHIVQSHRGEVWVECEIGQGTTFHFTLPAE